MFMIVQFLGLLLSIPLFSGATYQEITSAQVISSPVNALFYIVYIVVFSVVLLLIFKVYKGKKLFVVLEGAIVLLSSFIVFSIIVAVLAGSAHPADTWQLMTPTPQAQPTMIEKTMKEDRRDYERYRTQQKTKRPCTP